MLATALLPENLAHAWKVLLLFVVPFGGGIPAGVVVAKGYGLPWQEMAVLYFVSDLILACVFEPLMLWFLRWSRGTPKANLFRELLKQNVLRMLGRVGMSLGPFTLVWITFGSDPMTGRSVAKMAGHGFLTGWALTIAGDMLFFLVLMASTLWLNDLLGNGTAAAIVITVVMLVVPGLLKRLRR